MTEHRFSAEIRATGRSGHAVEVPKDLAGGLAGRRTPVAAHVDGVEYRARVGAYGGRVYLWLRQDLLRKLGRGAGDTVEILVSADAEPEPEAPAPVVEPPDLVAALAEDNRRGRRTRPCRPSTGASTGPGSAARSSPRPGRTGWPGPSGVCGGSRQQRVLDHLG